MIPTNLQLPIHTISTVIFAVAVLMVIFYSGLTIYSLLHFGKSRALGALVSAVYVVLTLILIVDAYLKLNSI